MRMSYLNQNFKLFIMKTKNGNSGLMMANVPSHQIGISLVLRENWSLVQDNNVHFYSNSYHLENQLVNHAI